MNDTNNRRTYIAAAVAIVAVIALVILASSRPSGTQSGPTTASSTALSPVPATTAARSAEVPVRSPTQSATRQYSQQSSYNNYVQQSAQIGAGQNACKNAATSQFKELYGSLSSGSLQNYYYNQNSGLCYMKVSGALTQAYSASTTGVIYFRDVTKGSIIAACADPKGMTNADVDWSCTDKVTGQGMNIAAFNALIYQYATQR